MMEETVVDLLCPVSNLAFLIENFLINNCHANTVCLMQIMIANVVRAKFTNILIFIDMQKKEF